MASGRWKRQHRVRDDLLWGISEGVRRAKYYSGIALIVSLGRAVVGVQSALAILPLILIGYFIAGVVAGAIVGLLRPLAVSFLGYLLIGSPAAVPVAFAMGLIVLPSKEWQSELVSLSLGAALLFGPIFGGVARRLLVQQKVNYNVAR